MKAPRCITSSIIAVFLLLLPLISISSADDTSTVRLLIGYTQIKLEESFVSEIVAANTKIRALKPGFLNLKRRVAVFPIVGGAFDQNVGGAVDQGNYLIEVFHTGGLAIEPEDGFPAQIFNFVMSTITESSEVPIISPFELPPPPMSSDENIGEMTSLTTIEGTIQNREPLFTLTFPEDFAKTKRNKLFIKDIIVTIENFDQVDRLDTLLGTSFWAQPLPIKVGTAKIFARYHKDWYQLKW